MSHLAQSSNVITAEIANQELVKALQQLEVTVGHGLRLQQMPNDAFALETRRQLGRDIGYALVSTPAHHSSYDPAMIILYRMIFSTNTVMRPPWYLLVCYPWHWRSICVKPAH
jgi:hypothetical protein